MYQTYLVYPRRSGMGAAYVPFTFPTASVYARMKYYGTTPASYGAVDQMYTYYVQGIAQQGAKPIDFKASDSANKTIWQWMGKKYDAKTTQNFFRALHDIPEQWWRLGKNTVGSTVPAAISSIVGKAGKTVTAAASTAGEITGATASAFFGKMPLWLKIGGSLALALTVAGGGYIIVKKAGVR